MDAARSVDYEPLDPRLNALSGEVIDAAMKVHRHFGPGLLESAYRACLVAELRARAVRVDEEVEVPLVWEGRRVDRAYRLDVLVEEDALIVEIKAVEQLLPVHRSQLWTYLKLTDRRLGLLLNFNVHRLKDGIVRVIR